MEPTNTTSTAVQPTFEIITAYPIDTTSVHWVLSFPDSIHALLSSICVLPYPVFATQHDTLNSADTIWAAMAAPGTGEIINDTTIELTLAGLTNNLPYEAILMGLRVIDSAGDTISISDTVARLLFHTIDLPPRLVTINILDSGSLLLTHDTVTAKFSAKLDSANSAAGSILSIVVPHMSYDSASDSVILSDSEISATSWLDAWDSSKIHILPNQAFNPGQDYKLKVKLSGLTGDTTDNSIWSFTCRKSFRLDIKAVPIGGLTCLDTVHFDPAIDENYKLRYDSSFDSSTMTEVYDTSVVYDSDFVGTIVNAGDTVRYTAPTQVGGAIFKQWTGSGNPAIDTSTNPTVTVSETADQLNDMNIVALYGPVSVDTVCVSTSGTNTADVNSDFVAVSSDSQDCPNATLQDTCASQSSVNYLVERGKVVTLHAYTTSDSIMFDHWSSSDSHLNWQKSSSISFYTNGNDCATAVFNPTPQSPCQIAAYIKLDDGSDAPLSIATISSFTPYPPNTLIGTCCTYKPVTLQILDPRYGLMSYSIDGEYLKPDNTCDKIDFSHDFMNDFHIDEFQQAYDLFGSYSYTPPFPIASNGSFTPPITATPPIVPVQQTTAFSEGITTVTYTLKKLLKRLTIVIQTDDNSLPPEEATKVTTDNTAKNMLWCLVSPPPEHFVHHGIRRPAGGAAQTYEIYDLYYYAGTPVTLTCGADATQGCYFIEWEAGGSNTEPTTTSYSTELDLTADQMLTDNYVTATFHVKFRLETLTFYYVDQDNNRYQTTLSADNWPTKPLASDPTQNVTSWFSSWDYDHPVGVQLHFSKAVSANSTVKGIEGGDGYDVTTQVERPDLCTYRSTYGSYPFPTGSYDNAYLVDPQTVLLGLRGSDFGAKAYTWKGQTFSINIDFVFSTSNESPTNKKTTFDFKTVGPDVSWYYDDTKVEDSHSNMCYSSDSWIDWAAFHGTDPKGPFLPGLENIRGGVSCWTTGVRDGTTCIESAYAPVSPWGAWDQSCTSTDGMLFMISGNHVAATDYFSAGAENAVVNNDFDYSCWHFWAEYDDNTLRAEYLAHYDNAVYRFNLDLSKKPWLWGVDYDGNALLNEIGSVYSDGTFTGGDENYYYILPDLCAPDGSGNPIHWAMNCMSDYPLATKPDWWGAGAKYRSYWWVNDDSFSKMRITVELH